MFHYHLFLETCPLEPSELNIVNVVPPDVNFKFEPSEDTDSLESWNCNVNVPPLSSNNNGDVT